MCIRDSARIASHLFDHIIHRMTGVNNNRQIMAASQVQMSGEILSLLVVVEIRQIVIQPAFANRYRSLANQPVGQHIKMFVPMFGQPGRMQAVAGIQPRITDRHGFKLRPQPGTDRRQHLRLYAGGMRPLVGLSLIHI